MAENSKDLKRLISVEREEQRQAITSLRKLTVVSAGAGTGKTHTLARRFAWLLASDPNCRVEQILTLTFTRLAANEMRERIKRTLRDWRDSDPVALGHLSDAIERIDEAYISTVHSFALRVIRESGLELDIDPGASLIGEAIESDFWEDYRWSLKTVEPRRISMGLTEEWRSIVKEHMSSKSYVTFLNYFGARTLAMLAKGAGEVFGSMNELPADFLPSRHEREEAVRRRIAVSVSSELRCIWETWRGRVFPAISEELEHGKNNVFTAKLREFHGRWRWGDADEATMAKFAADLICEALSGLPARSGLKDMIEDALGEKLVDWREKFRNSAEICSSLFASPPYSETESESRRMLLESAAIGWESWDAARRRAGGLSFSDLMRYASRILCGGTYASRFKHVMVDEFQDTDGLQDAMLSALASGIGDGTVFIVGDIKQSIYRFRHAEPRIFAGYILRGDALNIPLSHSYRMSGAMKDAINRVFGYIWRDGVISPEEDDAGLVKYEPLLAPSDAPWWEERNGENRSRNSSPIEIILYDPHVRTSDDDLTPVYPSVSKTPVDEKRKRLAVALACRLRKMRESGEEIWDKGENRFRPVRWGDMAVLVQTRTPYRVIEETFDEAGIPAVFGSGREYFNRGEVRDIVNLLRALDNPLDDYAFAGWLESPLSGAAPGVALELAWLAGERGASLWEVFSENRPLDAARFSKLRRRAVLIGPSSALRQLLEDAAWILAYRPSVRARTLSNILRGVEIASDYELSLGRNLSACADYLGKAMRSQEAMDEPGPPDSGDFVQIKTVHASKGQEFPVVVLMGMENSVKPKFRGRAAVSRHLGIIAKNLPAPEPDGPAEAIESVTAQWSRFLEEMEEAEEKERLMYVAMTRAQDKLICCAVHDGTVSESRDSWIDWLLLANAEADGDRFSLSFVDDSNLPEVASARDRARLKNIAAPKRAETERPGVSLARISATAYSLFMWCPVAYRMRYRQGRNLKWELPDGDGYGGADLGSLAHWALARWNMELSGMDRLLPSGDLPYEIGERIKRTLPAFLRPIFASKRDREVLRSWLESFSATDECARLRELAARGALRRELAFLAPFEGANLVGSMDLYWEDERGGHVRDWKITLVDRAPAELYREQVNFYALVCRIASRSDDDAQKKPIDAGLIYLRPGASHGPVSEGWDASDLRETANNVKRVIEIAASGPFEPNRDRCRHCPFRAFCNKRE